MSPALIWILGSLPAVGLVLALAVMAAISHNGPAVLSTVDRITGGTQEAELLAEISTGDHPAQKLYVWGPSKAQREITRQAEPPRPVLVFTHGGSWQNGDPVDYGFVARAFVAEGFTVVLIGYRLGDAGIYPAMLQDTAAAIAWAKGNISAYGGDPERIVLSGHSAGAYNVTMMVLEEQWLAAHGLSPADISAVIGLAGPYDFAPFESDSTKAAFGHVADAASTQPIVFAATPPQNAPPFLLIHGEKDTLVRPRNSRVLAQALSQAGIAAQTHFEAAMEHNDPLISLAAPWRSRRDIATIMTRFANQHTGEAAGANTANMPQLSVPVQPE